MKQTRMKKAASVAIAVLTLSTLLPLQAMGATTDASSAGELLASIGDLVPLSTSTTTSKLRPEYPMMTATNGYQTVTVKMLDASGNLIADGADQIALETSNGIGAVIVADAGGNWIQPDSEGRFVVTAVNGIATFKVLDTSAETLTYTFTDVTVPTVPTGIMYGTFAAVSSYVFSPTPIAPNWTLGAGATKNVTVTAQDRYHHALAGASMYVTFTQATGGGSITAGSKKLSNNDPQLLTTDDTGKLSMVYTAPDPMPIAGGVDTIKVQDAYTNVSATDSYTLSKLKKFSFSASPIAANGVLQANKTTQVKVTAIDSSNLSFGKTQIFLSMKSFVGGGTAKVGNVTLTDVPTAFPTDSQGAVTIDYTTPATMPNGGQDVILAQNEEGDKPAISQSTSYTYATVYGYTFVPPSVMSGGKLKAGDTVDLALNVYSGRNVLMPGAKVYLSMTPGFGTANVGGIPVSTDSTVPTLVTANSNGQIDISYTAPNPVPAGGSLKFTVQDKQVSPSRTGSYTYSFVGVSGYRFYSSPIAPNGSLQPGETKDFSFIVDGTKGSPLGKTQVYLSIPSTNLGTIALKSNPTVPLAAGLVPVTTDAQGQVDLVYHAPVSFPNGGVDSLTVLDSATSLRPRSAKVTYTFASIYNFTTSPVNYIAPTGFLTPGQTLPIITFKATDASGNPIPNTKVYLTFTGAGTAAINNGATLGSTPTEAVTDLKGQVYLHYQVPAQLPVGGTDTITIRTVQANTGGKYKSLTYSYATVSSYQTDLPIKTPTVIATSGSLQASDQKTVTITVKNGSLPMANTVVYMKLTSSVAKTVLGTATANGTPLDTTLTKVVTDSNGQVVVTYTAANTLPTASSTDTLLIQGLLTTSKSLSLTYNYPRQTLR